MEVVKIGPARNMAQMSRIDRGIVAFVTDNDTARALTAGLAQLGDAFDLRRGGIEACIKTYQTATPPSVLIVDLGVTEDPQAALIRLANICPPDIKVFVIGEERDLGFYRALVHELGVTEYLAKPVARDAVQRVLLPRITGEMPGSDEFRGGRVVAVCGARGGVGTSSMAVSLAYELKDVTKAHVALVDLHINNGEIALMLGKQPGNGLRRAMESGNRIDELLLDRVSIELEPRLHLLASQEAWDIGANLFESSLVRLLEVLKRKYNYVVIDIPMPPPPAMRVVLQAARQIITVLTPDVASLRDTKNIIELVASITGTDRVLTLLNRYDMKGCLDRGLIEKTLGEKPHLLIPDLGGPMLHAINRGIPAVRHVSALRRHLAPLVSEISGLPRNQRPWDWLRPILRWTEAFMPKKSVDAEGRLQHGRTETPANVLLDRYVG